MSNEVFAKCRRRRLIWYKVKKNEIFDFIISYVGCTYMYVTVIEQLACLMYSLGVNLFFVLGLARGHWG